MIIFSRKGLIEQLEFEGYSTKMLLSPSSASMSTGTSKQPRRPRTTSTTTTSRAVGDRTVGIRRLHHRAGDVWGEPDGPLGGDLAAHLTWMFCHRIPIVPNETLRMWPSILLDARGSAGTRGCSTDRAADGTAR